MDKIIKRTLLIVSFVFFSACISGCAYFKFGTQEIPYNENSFGDTKRVGGELIQAIVDDNPKAFLELLPPVVRDEFGENGFKKTRESMLDQLGKPVSYEFVMNLEHPVFVISVWKIRYERKNTETNEMIYQESLFRAVSGKIDDEEKLLSFNFL